MKHFISTTELQSLAKGPNSAGPKFNPLGQWYSTTRPQTGYQVVGSLLPGHIERINN